MGSAPPLSVAGRLAGKVAVVVGAGQTHGETIGNGRATALAFASAGAQVLLVDQHRDSAGQTQEMVAALGGSAEVLVADITDEAQVSQIAPVCLARFGRIDVLDNNVGTGLGDDSVTKLSRERWDQLWSINVTGAFLTCKHVIPHLRAQGGGSVVNISSAAAVASTALAAYKVSKAALNALTSQLAMSNARHRVRVNAIMPGLLDTPMAISGYSKMRGISAVDLRDERNRQVPMGRMGTAWDTAYAAVYLASDEAAFVTGVIFPVDGGQSARVG